MTATDEHGNNVPIKSSKDFFFEIKDPAGEDQSYTATALADGVLRVEFQGTFIGVYNIIVPDNCKGGKRQYNLEVIPGKLDTFVSTSTIDDTDTSNTFVAGGAISFSVIGKDKQGNVIDYTDQL